MYVPGRRCEISITIDLAPFSLVIVTFGVKSSPSNELIFKLSVIRSLLTIVIFVDEGFGYT